MALNKGGRGMKTILVLGAGVYQYPLIEAASKYGKVIVVAPEISEDINKYIDKKYICDVTDQQKILEIAASEKIDAVVTDQTDIAVRTVAYVAEKLNLPGIGYDTACLFTDKARMRKKLSEIGIPVLPNMEVNNLEDALSFFNFLNVPVIIKPSDNQGSRGVFRINNAEELKNKFDESIAFSRSQSVVIEKLACGREFVVEGLTYNNNYHTLICGDTDYFSIPDAYAAKTRTFPSRAPKGLVNRVCELNKKIIEGFGLSNGISHSEFIMDGDEIYLIETAARGGGVFISSDLIYLGSGVKSEDFLINLALGNNDIKINITSGKCCGYLAFYLSNGIVQSVDGIEKVKSLEYVHRNLLDNIHVGMHVKNSNDKTSRYSIIVSADSNEQLYERMNTIKNILSVKSLDENGNLGDIIWN